MLKIRYHNSPNLLLADCFLVNFVQNSSHAQYDRMIEVDSFVAHVIEKHNKSFDFWAAHTTRQHNKQPIDAASKVKCGTRAQTKARSALTKVRVVRLRHAQ